MNRTFLLLCTAITVLTLSSCGALFKNENAKFKNHGKDYLEAKPLKVIVVPDGVDEPAFTPLFPVPALSARDEFGDVLQLSEYEVPRPESPYNREAAFGVKIQKLSGQQWMSLGVPSNQAWPRVQNYLAVNTIPVVFSNAQSGIIETEWLKFNNDEENAVRFRILIEKGVHPETTEMHVLANHVPYEEQSLDTSAPWPAVSDDTEKEAWFLRQIAEHLAGSIDNASATLLGQDVGGKVKVSFLKDAAEPTMEMRLSDARAWVSVRQAASSNGFVRWGASEKQGVLFVGFDPKLAKEKGFWGKAFSLGRDSSLPETSTYPLDEVLLHLSAERSGKALFESIPDSAFDSALSELEAGYLIVVTRKAGVSNVVIRDQRGRLLQSEQAKALLRALRGNLI